MASGDAAGGAASRIVAAGLKSRGSGRWADAEAQQRECRWSESIACVIRQCSASCLRRLRLRRRFRLRLAHRSAATAGGSRGMSRSVCGVYTYMRWGVRSGAPVSAHDCPLRVCTVRWCRARWRWRAQIRIADCFPRWLGRIGSDRAV